MPILLDEDYKEMEAQGFSYIEDEALRFLVLTDYKLPKGIYDHELCDVLIVIPNNYPQAGNDMFWTNPRLSRLDGKLIPATNNMGGSDNRMFQEKEFCRWSRHWHHGKSVWRPGADGIETILRRIDWALRRPDAK
ncbi:hypothetical protein EUZ85_17455 [Hahella sp. KA22]|uniref:E2/UBC family protein n=1 Tax=Hahella sp. KA22 TaxID=1628392 RepID=UPI000FDDE02E|nr:E2/UBC family protein [Hahella sp. KA22]AZZ92411.1 hypothetical protein ENC22_14880 [Hahella sp. KA22]QAY55786.1 hypothetical protein EUZ85_17455 [Hahella sp. KA22]